MIVMHGTVTNEVAFIMFMIQPGAPFRSASLPTTKPGVSISRSERDVEAVAEHLEVDDLAHRIDRERPAAHGGLFAMMPTTLPPRRASAVTAARPKRGFSSKTLSRSAMISMILRMS